MARQGREMETGMSPRRCSLCSGRMGWSRSRDASADRVRTWWPSGVRPRKAWLRRGISLPSLIGGLGENIAPAELPVRRSGGPQIFVFDPPERIRGTPCKIEMVLKEIA